MEAKRWERVQELFLAALERQPEERSRFLLEAYPDDLDVHDEVRKLLAAHTEDGRFDRLVEGMAPLLSEPGPAAQPEQVGAYRIVRELGHGGMGTVFLAERSDGQFDHQVALKLLRHDLAGGDLHRRFLAERQILAHLRHPNIARLFDGGLTENGRPYIVMEHVEGVPIDVYCDERRLEVDERLALFRTACAAVHYAHRHLVVHRDLKPANILVTEEGTVKLLDFGIAKLLDPEDFAQSVAVTQTGMWLMTPDYASPEQVRGEAVTTGSDVYQLGVLLYELLTGHKPYRLPSRSLQDVNRLVCETQPERPSTVVDQAESVTHGNGETVEITPESVSRSRGTSSERLRRRLRGDLDNIVLLALRKEPERRYGSVEQFSEDLRRYLEKLPVTARRDTVWYRASSFARRNRIGVAAALAILVLVVGFGVAMALQAKRTALARDKAEHVASFLVDLFEVSDPDEARGNSVTAREILDKGAERVKTELRAEPEVQAAMMDVIGRVYVNLGLYEPARPLLDQALALRRQMQGPKASEVAASLHSLGVLHAEKGEYEEAEALYRESLTMRRDLLNEPHPELAESLNALGQILQATNKLDRSESVLREALAMRRALFGEVHPEVAGSRQNLALVLHRKGDYDDAERLYREVIATKRELFGDVHPDLAITMTNLGWLHDALGDLDAAETLFREVLAMRRKLYGERHPFVGRTLGVLANLLIERGRYEDAEPLAREALAMHREVLGEENPYVAADLYSLAKIEQSKGDLEAAETLYREAIAASRRDSSARALNALGSLLEDKGDLEAAESLYRESWTIYRENLGDAHPFVAIVKCNVAASLHAQGSYEAAESMFREALGTLRAAWGDEHPRVTTLTLKLGRLLVDRNEYDEAEPLLLDAYSVLSSRDDQHDQTREVLEELIGLYETGSRRQEADRYRALLAAL